MVLTSCNKLISSMISNSVFENLKKVFLGDYSLAPMAVFVLHESMARVGQKSPIAYGSILGSLKRDDFQFKSWRK